jgi:hypothetical protein
MVAKSARLILVLFTPARHEPLGDVHFGAVAAREAISRIAMRAARDLDSAACLWPRDPADEMDAGEGRASSLYWGAAGIAWALGELQAPDYVTAAFLAALEHRLLNDSSDPDFGEEGVWWGEAGVLAVAEHFWPDETRRNRLAELAGASLPSAALEPMVGHPGYMALAAQLHARTGEGRWAEFWHAGAERLLAEWRHDEELDAWLWQQNFGKDDVRYLGAAHGLAGNVHVLLRGGLLAGEQRRHVERRAVATLKQFAVVEDATPTGPASPARRSSRTTASACSGATARPAS